MTIIAGFRCQDGIVVCADTQETSGPAKRNVPKLVFSRGPTLSAGQDKMINHDLALAMCGAGDGPFVDKVPVGRGTLCEGPQIYTKPRIPSSR